jgi:hypothetical protein
MMLKGKMVAPAGIEPARPFGLAILSRVRLPVPPRGHIIVNSAGRDLTQFL